MPLGKRLVQNAGSKVIEPREASSALAVSADISGSGVSFCDAPLISASHFARPIRVACVGDSITYGYGLTNRRRNCYPARLGDCLGNNWCVRNFGVNGAMLLKNGTRPYCKERVYQRALVFKPDVVIIMLGTNDTKRDSWETHQTEFASDYRELIRSFRGLPTKPRLYLCAPPPLFRDRGKLWDTDQVLRDKILQKINAVAVRSKLRVVDFYSTFAGQPEQFSDGVHPNAKGAEELAAIIHVVLTGRKATLPRSSLTR